MQYTTLILPPMHRKNNAFKGVYPARCGGLADMTGMSFAPTADIPLSLTHTLIFSWQLSTLSTGLSTALRLAGRERRCAAPILRRISPQFVAGRKLIHFSTDLSTIYMHYAPFYAYETAAARHGNAGCRTTKAAVLRKTAQKSGNRMRKCSYGLSAARACASVTEDLCKNPPCMPEQRR